jgi:hypothetical protein
MASIWTPGAGSVQQGYSRELAGAMLTESDEFFDRALALYLLRSHLRESQASTWAGVACYYANYFLALSFIRLHRRSVTHVSPGSIFEVTPTDDRLPQFKVKQVQRRQRHTEVWETYYDLVSQLAWPDAATVIALAPTLQSLRFREQLYRERINYRPGDGFEEICQKRPRYLQSLKAILKDNGSTAVQLSDAAYTDRMAAQRLTHIATLLRGLSSSRTDIDIEASCWQRRREMVPRYAQNRTDQRFCSSLMPPAV